MATAEKDGTSEQLVTFYKRLCILVVPERTSSENFRMAAFENLFVHDGELSVEWLTSTGLLWRLLSAIVSLFPGVHARRDIDTSLSILSWAFQAWQFSNIIGGGGAFVCLRQWLRACYPCSLLFCNLYFWSKWCVALLCYCLWPSWKRLCFFYENPRKWLYLPYRFHGAIHVSMWWPVYVVVILDGVH